MQEYSPKQNLAVAFVSCLHVRSGLDKDKKMFSFVKKDLLTLLMTILMAMLLTVLTSMIAVQSS